MTKHRESGAVHRLHRNLTGQVEGRIQMVLSAKEAAEHVGMSRQAIIKAIRRGKISAVKNHNGEWQIDPSELFRVYKSVDSVYSNTKGQVEDRIQEVTGVSSSEIKLLRELIEHLKTDKEDLKADRERLLKLLEEQSASLKALTDQRTPERPKGFWRWLVGRH